MMPYLAFCCQKRHGWNRQELVGASSHAVCKRIFGIAELIVCLHQTPDQHEIAKGNAAPGGLSLSARNHSFRRSSVIGWLPTRSNWPGSMVDTVVAALRLAQKGRCPSRRQASHAPAGQRMDHACGGDLSIRTMSGLMASLTDGQMLARSSER